MFHLFLHFSQMAVLTEFRHARICIAHRRTFWWISLSPGLAKSTNIFSSTSLITTSLHPPCFDSWSFFAPVPDKKGITHKSRSSRIIQSYSSSSSAEFCRELCRPGRRLISMRYMLSNLSRRIMFSGAHAASTGRKSRPNNSKWPEDACQMVRYAAQ